MKIDKTVIQEVSLMFILSIAQAIRLYEEDGDRDMAYARMHEINGVLMMTDYLTRHLEKKEADYED